MDYSFYFEEFFLNSFSIQTLIPFLLFIFLAISGGNNKIKITNLEISDLKTNNYNNNVFAPDYK